jgi:hypothetical protein
MNDAKAVPCDVFVWGRGKAPDPRMTRVGGVPFLPRHVTWPTIQGCVSTFLCQFDFTDSHDLVPKLPGDLLLVFVRALESLWEDSGQADEELAFVWVANDETDIITRREIPKATHPFAFVEAWGVRHRTVDMPRWLGRDELTDFHGGEWLPVMQATKIGGVPYDSQPSTRRLPTGYLCQLVTVHPRRGVAWPWVDVRPRIGKFAPINERNELMIGDVGELTLRCTAKGKLKARIAW